MTTSSQINFEPFSLFFSEFVHALVRPAVGFQILLIFISLIVGILGVLKLRKYINIYGFKFNKKAIAPLFSLVLISVFNVILDLSDAPSGLLKETGILLIIYSVFSLLFQVMIQLTDSSKVHIIKGYRDKLFIPSFLLYCFYVFVQIFGDPVSLFTTPVINLFETSFNFLDAILLSIGLVLWVVFSTLIAESFEWIFSVRSGHNREFSKAVYALIRYGLIGFGLFVILGFIGINSTIFGFVTGGLSVGIGFGLKEIVSNFASGIWLLLERSTKPGDVINLSSLGNSSELIQVAEITDCGLRAVTVTCESDHSERIIPNNLFFTNQIITYTKNHNVIARKSFFGVEYEVDPNLVIDLVTPAILKHPDVVENPPPLTVFVEYGDSSLNFYAKYYTKDVMNSGIGVTSEVNFIIWKILKDNNIEVPFPKQTLHFPDAIRVWNSSEDS